MTPLDPFILSKLPTYRPGETWVFNGAGDSITLSRVVNGESVGTIRIGPSPLQPNGLRISPDGDVPYNVLEIVRREVVAAIHDIGGRQVHTIVTDRSLEDRATRTGVLGGGS